VSWSYLDGGRHLLDAVSLVVFATALIATFSIDGAVTLSVTLVAFGLLRRGPRRDRLLALIVAVAVIAALFATPLGAHRLSRESSTSLATEQRGEPNTSLAWRLHKWKLLRAEWERSPAFGRGLGSTVTAEGIPGNRYAGEPPHNEYIRYLVETGVVGSALLLGGLTVLILRLARIRRSAANTNRDSFNEGALALAAVIGCLVNSLAGNTLLNSPTCYAAALIVFAVLGSAPRRRTAPTIAS
jgi:O-antigen ligase